MKEKIDLLNEKIKISLGEYYNGAYISYNTPLFHLEPLFELHKIK